MAKNAQRLGDRNTAGGIVVTGDSSVLINGRPAAVRDASVSAHPCCGSRGCPPIHCNAKTSATNRSVLVNGRPLIVAGDTDTCGHVRSLGSPDVFVGN